MPHPAVVQTVIDEGGFLDLATTGEVQLVRRLGVAPRALHPHPSDQARPRHPQRARLRRAAPSSPTTPTRCASSRACRDRRAAAAARLVPQPRRGVRPVAQVRLRPGGSPGAGARWRPTSASTSPGCRSTSARRPAMPTKHVEAIEACAKLMRLARREKLGSFDTLDIGGGFPIDYGAAGAGHRPLLRADPRRAREAPGAHARHRRAGALHRRAGRDRRRLGHGPRAARRALVVLPRRRPVRLLQRPAVRSRALSGRAAARERRSACPRCSPARPATAST